MQLCVFRIDRDYVEMSLTLVVSWIWDVSSFFMAKWILSSFAIGLTSLTHFRSAVLLVAKALDEASDEAYWVVGAPSLDLRWSLTRFFIASWFAWKVVRHFSAVVFPSSMNQHFLMIVSTLPVRSFKLIKKNGDLSMTFIYINKAKEADVQFGATVLGWSSNWNLFF